MSKSVAEFVWPVEGYTDKIHSGMKIMFQMNPNLSYTVDQMKEHLTRGYSWLKDPNDHQSAVLKKLITTGIKKLIQLGLVKKVTSSVSVEAQWQSAKGVAVSGYTNVTSEDAVAKTDAAKKAAKGRAVGGQTLWRLNNVERPSIDLVGSCSALQVG